MIRFRNPRPRICAHEDAWDDPSYAPPTVSRRYFRSNLARLKFKMLTKSIESFAIVMTTSIVELNGKCSVVLAFHPSDALP